MTYGTDYCKTQQLIDSWELEVSEEVDASDSMLRILVSLNMQLEELRDEIQKLKQENERLESIGSSLEYQLNMLRM